MCRGGAKDLSRGGGAFPRGRPRPQVSSEPTGTRPFCLSRDWAREVWFLTFLGGGLDFSRGAVPPWRGVSVAGVLVPSGTQAPSFPRGTCLCKRSSLRHGQAWGASCRLAWVWGLGGGPPEARPPRFCPHPCACLPACGAGGTGLIPGYVLFSFRAFEVGIRAQSEADPPSGTDSRPRRPGSEPHEWGKGRPPSREAEPGPGAAETGPARGGRF